MMNVQIFVPKPEQGAQIASGSQAASDWPTSSISTVVIAIFEIASNSDPSSNPFLLQAAALELPSSNNFLKDMDSDYGLPWALA